MHCGNGVGCRFKLSSPSEPGDVQDMLGINEEGSFVLSAKVSCDSPGRLQLSRCDVLS